MSRHRLWDAPKPTGYRVGPTVIGASPFPLLWQSDPRVDDGHRHRWETVLLTGRNVRLDEVVRCAVCLAPRCSGPKDWNPCMLRRHHRSDHHLLYGHLQSICRAGRDGRTDEELEARLGMRRPSPGNRRGELVIGGWVRDSGHTRPTRSGNPAIVWVLTDAGRARLEADSTGELTEAGPNRSEP